MTKHILNGEGGAGRDRSRDLWFEATASRYQDTGDEERSGEKARIRVVGEHDGVEGGPVVSEVLARHRAYL